MSTNLELTEFNLIALLMIAVLVAVSATALRVPYMVALVLVGFVVGIANLFDLTLSRALILQVFLPPLLFEAALDLHLEELRRRWLQITALAVPGTLITAGAIALAIVALTALDLRFAILLGVILAPTDPVSVLATLKEHRVAEGLRTLLGGESIFNDALGVALFAAGLGYAFGEGGTFDGVAALGDLIWSLVAGSLVGIGAGLLAHRLMRMVDDHLIEIMLSIVAAFGAAIVAERIGGSGLVATIGAGLLVGYYKPHLAQSAASRERLLLFWEVVAFLLNSALFLLIGLQLDVRHLAEGSTGLVTLAAIVGMLVGRLLVVYLLLRPITTAGERILPSWRHAIFWGGLRGAIPVALVLGLTASEQQIGDVNAVGVVFGVVFFSLVVQGLSFRPLLQRASLLQPEPAVTPAID
jgi:CPA1 family monovalent cation:H+ antiporter